jgi:hypothetical protein
MRLIFTILLGLTIAASCEAQVSTKAKSENDAPSSVDGQSKGLSDETEQLSPSTYQAVVQSGLRSEDAWQSHYDACRVKLQQNGLKDISSKEQETLDELVKSMEMQIPHTFTFHYNAYINSASKANHFADLQAAYDLEPSNPVTYDDMAAFGELSENKTMKKEFLTKLSDAGVYSKAELEYNYNTLLSVEPGSILLTNGNLDTYPVWMLQELQAVNKTVHILNIDLLKQPSYMAKKSKQFGLPEFKGDYQKTAEVVDHFLSVDLSTPVYLSLTMPVEILKDHTKNLWLTGLAFKHLNSGEMANLPTLAYNWETTFKKDYLKSNIGLNKNYIMLLAMLNEYYENQGREAEMQEIRSWLAIIAPKTGKPQQVKQISTY